MADNNIKVNWIVNTADVERAKQILAQADAVGNKFQQSAQQGFRNTAAEAARLTAEEKRLETAIKSLHVSQFKTYKDFVKNLQNLSKQYSDVKIKIDFVNKALNEQAKLQKSVNEATKQTATSTGQLASKANELYSAIKLVLAAGLAREILQTGLEMAKLSGNVEGVERAFFRAFPQGTSLLNELRRSTHGTISDFELMQRTLQASNLGVSAERLGVLFEFAATRAQQTGESVDYLVDSIVRGIGRKSILVLDNLGLSATRLREQFNGAAIASKSVAEVTEGVAQIAQVELQKMGGYAETSATKVDALKVAWEELGIEVAKWTTQEGGAVDFLKSYVDTYKTLFEAINNGVSFQEMSAQKSREEKAAIQELSFAQNYLTGSKEEQIKVLEQEIAQITKAIGSWAQFRDEMDKNIENIKKEYDGRYLMQGIRDQEIAQTERIRDAKKEDALQDQELLKLLLLRLAALKEVKVATDQLGLIAAKEEEIKGVMDAISDAKTTSEIHKLNVELSTLQGQLADLKAFGTTKQFLEVNGQVKLVPIEEYKIKQYKVQTENAIGELEVKTKPVLGQNTAAATKQLEAEVQQMINNMRFTIPPPAPSSSGVTPMSEWERIGEEFAANWQNILNQGIGDTTMVIDAAIQKEADAYAARINQAQMYYDGLMILAGDNEKEKDRLRLRELREVNRLRREAFEADKRAKRSTAVINGAAGIVNAFATLPYPAALVASLLIAAQTAAQISVINAEQPRFAKGVIDLKGPGSKTSDSIPARLSKGESVMTADETGSSMGILKDIRAGKLNDRLLARKLDSGILKDLKLSKNGVTYAPPMDDTRLVSKMDQLINAQPDFKEMNGQLWEARRKSKNYKQWVRAKIM